MLFSHEINKKVKNFFYSSINDNLKRIVNFILRKSPFQLGSHLMKFNSSISQKSTILELDQILDAADSLEDFLNNKLLQERYFQTAATYFGSKKFKLASYEAILSQMKSISFEIPEISSRLWNREIVPMVSNLSSITPTSGRTLNLILWRLYRSNWLSNIRAACNIGSNDRDLSYHFKKVCKDLNEIIRETNEWNHYITKIKPHLKSRSLLKEKTQFYLKLRKDLRLKRAAAYFILDYLFNYKINYFLALDDADLVLDFFKNLKQFPSQVLSREWKINPPEALLSCIKDWVPDTTVLLHDYHMFPRADSSSFIRNNKPMGYSKTATFTTRRIRPFHGVWVGVTLADCVGGDPDSLSKLSARRWTASCIQGAHTFAFEQNGKYVGFINSIPFMGTNGKIYGSFELAIPNIGRQVIVARSSGKLDENNYTKYPILLFDLWFPQYLKTLPKEWDGIIISDSVLCDLVQIKDVIRGSPHFISAKIIGTSKDFKLIDPISKKIVAFDRNPAINEYGLGLILDLSLVDSRNIYQFNHVSNELIQSILPSLDTISKKRFNNYLNHSHGN